MFYHTIHIMLFTATKTFPGILFQVLNSTFVNTSEGLVEMTYFQQISNVHL